VAKQKRLEHLEELDRPVDLNIKKVAQINSRNGEKFFVYTVLPCKKYTKCELLYMALNNPDYVKYDEKHDCFYMTYYAFIYLSYECASSFYVKFMAATKKDIRGINYLENSKKYLRRYAELRSRDE
jgi:hypothetical protein